MTTLLDIPNINTLWDRKIYKEKVFNGYDKYHTNMAGRRIELSPAEANQWVEHHNTRIITLGE